MAALRGVRSLLRGFAGVAAGASAGFCAADDEGVEVVVCAAAAAAAVVELVVVLAKAGLDCCATCSGIERLGRGGDCECGGGLVSCTCGNGGDWMGRVMEVSGAAALRGGEGGCVGSEYDWKAAAKAGDVDENWRTRLRRQAWHIEGTRRASILDVFMATSLSISLSVCVSVCMSGCVRGWELGACA